MILVKTMRRHGFVGTLSLLLVFTLVCLEASLAYPGSASPDVFTITDDKRITANSDGLSLSEALASLSRKIPLEVKGFVDEDKKVSFHFNNLKLKEALDQILAGYNYALVTRGQDNWLLVVFGAFDRPTQEERAISRSTQDNTPAASVAPVDSTQPSSASPSTTAAPPPAKAETAPAVPQQGSPVDQNMTSGQYPAVSPDFNPAAWGASSRRSGAGRR
jgi:hypothetical protein